MSFGAESGLVSSDRERLLAITGRPVTVEEYRDRSVRAVTGAWCEYEAQGRDFERSAYLPARVSYVDDDLVVAVTDLARTRFVTCFHEHFDGRQPPHGRNPGSGVSDRPAAAPLPRRLEAQGEGTADHQPQGGSRWLTTDES